MRHRHGPRHIIALGLALALWGCGDSLAPRFELERARDLWAAMRPDAYAFVLLRSCNCLREMGGPVAIEVDPDGNVSRQYVHSQQAVTETYAQLFPTVDGLFDFVDEALARNAHRVRATYDANLAIRSGSTSISWNRAWTTRSVTSSATSLSAEPRAPRHRGPADIRSTGGS